MNWKKLVLIAVAVIVTVLWLALGVGIFVMKTVGFDKTLWVALVTTTAFATEAAFWIVATILGLSVVQARKTVWRWLTRPFRGRSDAVG
jgi:hypothetical protein